MKCPLCLSTCEDFFIASNKKRYFKCQICKLCFLEPSSRLARLDEHKRYKMHVNTVLSPGYLKFLNMIIRPMLRYIEKEMVGIDYGSGPTNVLSLILTKMGRICYCYDPFFCPDFFDKNFDFMFATECFEHFYQPNCDLIKIVKILKVNSIVGIMTDFLPEDNNVKNWYYLRDNTHVSFFSLETFRYICESFNFTILWSDYKRCVILKKL